MLPKFYATTIVWTKVTNIILDDSNLSFLLPPLSLSLSSSPTFSSCSFYTSSFSPFLSYTSVSLCLLTASANSLPTGFNYKGENISPEAQMPNASRQMRLQGAKLRELVLWSLKQNSSIFRNEGKESRQSASSRSLSSSPPSSHSAMSTSWAVDIVMDGQEDAGTEALLDDEHRRIK